ncbi:MAG: PLP-dependent aminotransferase family protein [Edaphobacter sp.]
MRRAILDGRLRAGTTLPSSRNLAAQYGIARGTVVAAFEQLHAEGFLLTELGVGTHVTAALANNGKPQPARHAQAPIASRTRGALRGAKLLPLGNGVGRAFRSYEPAIDSFPTETWARVSSRVLRRAPRSLYGQGEPLGYMPLRRVIAEYLGASRGIRCSPNEIAITSGTQQGLDLLCRLLVNDGDEVWVEDPGYPGIVQAVRNAGGNVVSIPVDGEGMQVELGIRKAPSAKLAYVTPSNQFPLGVTLSATRRLELLRWAAKGRRWIIEDEYDAEYRFEGHPVAALKSLDRTGCVLYTGTFTKMLFNALRLGFVVVPEGLIEPLEMLKSYMDRHPPTLNQAVLAEFISDGHFGRHVRKMKQMYFERMDILVEEGRKHLKGAIEIQRAEGGMRTIGWLPEGSSDLRAASAAAELDLETLPISEFSRLAKCKPGLMLGFAGCHPEELRRGVALLGSTVGKYPPGNKTG